MKFKIPENIMVGSVKFKIVQKKSISNASFDFTKNTLTLGTKELEKNPSEFFNALVHEIFEMYTVSLYLRYVRPDANYCYEFHFDHRNFTNLCEMASKTISEFIE